MRRTMPCGVLLAVLLAAVPAAAAEATVDATQPGRIDGIAVSAVDDQPIADFPVGVFRVVTTVDAYPEPWVPETPEASRIPVATLRTGADGAFRFAGLAFGTYAVRPLVRGPPIEEVRALLPEAPSASVRVLWSPPTRVRGVALTELREPLGGVFVYVVATDSLDGPRAHPSLDPRVETDAEGRFELFGVPDGGVYVQAGRRRRGYSKPIRIELRPGESLDGITLIVPDESARLGGDLRGGLGVSLRFEVAGPVIESVRPGSGAADAGLLAGDVVAEVDGRSALLMSQTEFLGRARGAPGQPVELAVVRAGKLLTMRVIRKEIEVSPP
jgi:hypothetical protein